MWMWLQFEWMGDEAINNAAYQTAAGLVGKATLFRSDEHRLVTKSRGRPWSFDGDGALLRLVTEANRIKLAHIFDPCLAIHTSDWRQGPATDGGRHFPHQNGENCRRKKQAGCEMSAPFWREGSTHPLTH